MTKKGVRWWIPIGFGILCPAQAVACEPILPLVQLFAGPYLVMESVTWLAVAVAVKCVAYAVLEPGASRVSSAGKMFVANVVSTLGGLVMILGFSAPALYLFIMPFVWILSTGPARRLLEHLGRHAPNSRTVALVSAAFPVAMITTAILFWFSQAALAQEAHLVLYWLLKYAMVCLALLVSIFLSASWEEAVVARLGPRSVPQPFSEAVFRANFITVGVVMLAAAIRMLPRRLAAAHFLVHFFHLDRLVALS